MQYLREYLNGDLQCSLTSVFFSEDWDFGTMRFLNDGAGEIRLESEDIIFRANGALGETPTIQVQDMILEASPPRVGEAAPAANVFARCGSDLVNGSAINWEMTESHGLEGSVTDGRAVLQYVSFQRMRTEALPQGLFREYEGFAKDIIPDDFLRLFPTTLFVDNVLGNCQRVCSFSSEDSDVEYALLLQDSVAWVRLQVQVQQEQQEQEELENRIRWHRSTLIDALSFLWGEPVRSLAIVKQTSMADIITFPARKPSMKKSRCFLPPVRVFPNGGRNPIALIRRTAEYFFADGLKVIRHLRGWWSTNTCYPEVQAAALILVLENIGRELISAEVEQADIIPALAQKCHIQLSPSVTEGLMQEVEALEHARAVSRSIDPAVAIQEIEHLYVLIRFLYNVILSQFDCKGFSFPNILVSEKSDE